MICSKVWACFLVSHLLQESMPSLCYAAREPRRECCAFVTASCSGILSKAEIFPASLEPEMQISARQRSEVLQHSSSLIIVQYACCSINEPKLNTDVPIPNFSRRAARFWGGPFSWSCACIGKCSNAFGSTCDFHRLNVISVSCMQSMRDLFYLYFIEDTLSCLG